ncbi:amidohydrolase family protein [Maricurvus nonylphenolicus]|uniref:amidohydrolase family protein n=1 Tax=Maricurvus nonylphenolicus TaxID=1008307 RepID=UPI0036F352EA
MSENALKSEKALKAIDTWVNIDHKWDEIPSWLVDVQKDYFNISELMSHITMDDMLRLMDDAGVEKSVLTIYGHKQPESTLEYVRQHPDRFALSVDVNPSGLMKEVWKLEELVDKYPVVMARVVPFALDNPIPPSHPHYYPLYAKCIELDLPIAINTGICGPVRPSDAQNPMHLDQVCYEFPDLKVCMAHGADPWWDVAIRLMLKYKNLRLMTSAYSPKYLPKQLIHFMNTRGKDKIIFASDFPLLQPKPIIEQAQNIGLSEESLENYLFNNAENFFFSKRNPRK